MKELHTYLSFRMAIKKNTATWGELSSFIFGVLLDQPCPEVGAILPNPAYWKIYLRFSFWLAHHADSVFPGAALKGVDAGKIFYLVFSMIAETKSLLSQEWQEQFMNRFGLNLFKIIVEIKSEYEGDQNVLSFYDFLEYYYLRVFITEVTSERTVPLVVLLDCVLNYADDQHLCPNPLNEQFNQYHHSQLFPPNRREKAYTLQTYPGLRQADHLLSKIYAQVNSSSMLRWRLHFSVRVAALDRSQSLDFKKIKTENCILFKTLEVLKVSLMSLKENTDLLKDQLPCQRYELSEVLPLVECCQFIRDYFKVGDCAELSFLHMALAEWIKRVVLMDFNSLPVSVSLRIFDLYLCVLLDISEPVWENLAGVDEYKKLAKMFLEKVQRIWYHGFLISTKNTTVWLGALERLAALMNVSDQRQFYTSVIDACCAFGNLFLINQVQTLSGESGFVKALMFRFFSQDLRSLSFRIELGEARGDAIHEQGVGALTQMIFMMGVNLITMDQAQESSVLQQTVRLYGEKYLNTFLKWFVQYEGAVGQLVELPKQLSVLWSRIELPRAFHGVDMTSYVLRVFNVDSVLQLIMRPKPVDCQVVAMPSVDASMANGTLDVDNTEEQSQLNSLGV